MPHKIYYLAKAQEDLESILDFIAQDSLQRAQDYLQFLQISINKLADFPKLGVTCKRKNIRRNCRILIIENYLIFYKIDEIAQKIFIGRILHRSVNYKNTNLTF
jgi:plasmid stabilization system protein ParE